MSEGIAIAIIAFLVVLTILNGLSIWFVFLFRELVMSRLKQGFQALDSPARTTEAQVRQLTLAIEKSDAQDAKLTSTLENNFDLLKRSEALTRKQAEYKMFFSLIFETLTEDTKFIRSEFFRRFANVPEYEEVNSKIIAFENKIEQTRLLLKEQNMMENYDE